MAVVARHSGRALDVMRSTAAGLEPLLMPGDADVVLRHYSTSRVQELLGSVHPSRQWSTSKTRKEQLVVKSWWLVLIVTETESDRAVGTRALGRPSKSAPEQGKQEGKQETNPASKATKRKEEKAEEEEEEESAKKKKAPKRKMRNKIGTQQRDEKRGPRWRIGTVASAPRHG